MPYGVWIMHNRKKRQMVTICDTLPEAQDAVKEAATRIMRLEQYDHHVQMHGPDCMRSIDVQRLPSGHTIISQLV